jgi:prepilin-type N-terminal cleavage/methylation domain-containing protein
MYKRFEPIRNTKNTYVHSVKKLFFNKLNKRLSDGFTIVELLIVIVIIAILATIIIIAYNGIQQRATVASLQSDLTNASTQLKLFQVDNTSYPLTIDCTQPDSLTNKCLKIGSGSTYQYIANNTIPQTFCLAETKNNQSYNISQNGLVLASVCPILSLDATNIDSYPGSGTTWVDLSGLRNDGTLVAGVGYSSANGGALTFDGVGSYVSSATAQNYLDTVIIFEPDFSYNTVSGIVELISNGTTTDESLRFHNANGVGPWTISSVGNSNDWSYPAPSNYSVNGTNVTNLLAGWNILSGYRTNQTSFPSNFSYYLGTGYPGRYFKGKIAVVLMYNVQLSSSDRQQIFNTYRSRYGI